MREWYLGYRKPNTTESDYCGSYFLPVVSMDFIMTVPWHLCY